jgi:dGTPase
MCGDFPRDLISDDPLARILKDVGQQIVYCSKETLRLELRGRKVIKDLMDVFYEGVCVSEQDPRPNTFPGKSYNLLSNNYRVVYKDAVEHDEAIPMKYRRLQLLTDYIAGMTDTFACNLHTQLSNG